MTYCEGQNCDKKETCERYISEIPSSGIEQIKDFSIGGSGNSDTSGIGINPYCGRNSLYDYYIPKGLTNIAINKPQSLKDWKTLPTPCTLINIPNEYICKIHSVKDGINSDNIGEFSDGYHTFNELYHHRAILFAVICNQFKNLAWKSKLHSDETMYEDMFIVGINTPQGTATYHYNIEPYWDMFDIKELPKAPEWDGHTPDDAIKRIYSLTIADKPLTTLEMMNEANQNGLTYFSNDMYYSLDKGFYDHYDDTPWAGEAFKTLNDFINVNNWKISYNENHKEKNKRKSDK